MTDTDEAMQKFYEASKRVERTLQDYQRALERRARFLEAMLLVVQIIVPLGLLALAIRLGFFQ